MIALKINKKSVNMAKDVYSEIAKQRNSFTNVGIKVISYKAS